MPMSRRYLLRSMMTVATLTAANSWASQALATCLDADDFAGQLTNESEALAAVDAVASHLRDAQSKAQEDSNILLDRVYKNAKSLEDERALVDAVKRWRPHRNGASLPTDARLIDIAAKEELEINMNRICARESLRALKTIANKSKFREAYGKSEELLAGIAPSQPSIYSILTPGLEFPIETATYLLVGPDTPYDSDKAKYKGFKEYLQSNEETDEKWLARISVEKRNEALVTFNCKGKFYSPPGKAKEPFGAPLPEFAPELTDADKGEASLTDKRRHLTTNETTTLDFNCNQKIFLWGEWRKFPYCWDGKVHVQLTQRYSTNWGSIELDGSQFDKFLLFLLYNRAGVKCVAYTDTRSVIDANPAFKEMKAQYARLSKLA